MKVSRSTETNDIIRRLSTSISSTQEEPHSFRSRSRSSNVNFDIVIEECTPWLENGLDIMFEREYINSLQTDDKIKITQITTILKPFIFLGRFLGAVSSKSSISILRFIFVFLPVTICLIRIFDFVLKMTVSDPAFIATLITLLHFFKVFISTFYLVRMTGSSSTSFFTLWENMVQDYHRSLATKKLKPLAIVGLLYVVLYSMLSACAAYYISCETGFYILNLENILISNKFNIFNALFVFIAAIYNHLCQMIYALLCLGICFEFNHLIKTVNFENVIQNEKRLFALTLFRLYHYHLVKLTDILNELMSYYTFWMLIINVPMLFATLYVLGTGRWNTTDTAILFCSLTLLFLEILMILLPPSTITNTAVEPLFRVHEVSNNINQDGNIVHCLDEQETNDDSDADWVNRQMYRQVSLFVQQITGRRVGITCGGFFILSKEVLLTVFPMIFTYFKLIRQLANSAKFHCVCNCNDTIVQ